MKIKTIFFLNLFFFFLAPIYAQWDGAVSVDIDMSQLSNKTYENNIAAISPMVVGGKELDLSCAQNGMVGLKAVDIGTEVVITVCTKVDTIAYQVNQVTLTNGSGHKLRFNKGDGQDFDFNFKISPDTLNVYYDALVLQKGSIDQKQIIYKKYKINQQTKNLFLAAVATDFGELQANPGGSGGSFANSAANGINVTKFADGFAKFIASRFKQELTISFFNRFTNTLDDPKIRDLQVLFKNTHDELELIGDRFTHYEAYLSSLRQSMEYDCSQLPEQFKKLMDDPSSQLSEALDRLPNIHYMVYNALSFGLELKDSVHIGKALADLNFANNIGTKPVDQNLKGSLETVQLLSEGLRNIETSSNHSYWISKTEMEGLVGDFDLLNLFLGLLAEKSKNRQYQPGHKISF